MAASDRMVLGPLVGSIDQGTSSTRFLVSTSWGLGTPRALRSAGARRLLPSPASSRGPLGLCCALGEGQGERAAQGRAASAPAPVSCPEPASLCPPGGPGLPRREKRAPVDTGVAEPQPGVVAR